MPRASYHAALRLLPLVICVPLCAQQLWEKKDYRQWSRQECEKILADSPWAREYRMEKALIELLQTESSDRAREERPWITYQFQFRSALPLRQAVARLTALSANYDKFSDEQKRNFDAKAEKYLAAPFPDTILIHVIYESNTLSYQGDLARYWQTKTPELLRNSIFLMNSRGDKVEPVRLICGQGAQHEFDLYFPRQVNGQPILLPEDKTVSIELTHPPIDIFPSQRIFVEFKIAKMMVGGNLIH